MTWQGMKGKRERKGGKVLFREQESPQGIAEKTCIHEYSLFSQLPFIPATANSVSANNINAAQRLSVSRTRKGTEKVL